jgi:hypothetical protein
LAGVAAWDYRGTSFACSVLKECAICTDTVCAVESEASLGNVAEKGIGSTVGAVGDAGRSTPVASNVKARSRSEAYYWGWSRSIIGTSVYTFGTVALEVVAGLASFGYCIK